VTLCPSYVQERVKVAFSAFTPSAEYYHLNISRRPPLLDLRCPLQAFAGRARISLAHRRRVTYDGGDASYCRLSILNLATVTAALGAINSPANDIRNVRNFYAHHGKGAAERAAATNLFSNPLRPVVFELSAYTSGGNRVIESWIEALVAVATAAMQ
jgi:hypothetical protein